MNRVLSTAIWIGISVLGAAAFGYIALARGETIGAAWLIVAAVCTYLVAYRFYSRFIAEKVFELDPRRATPAERLNNGRDFHPTNKWILFGHHFSAISGAGPLVGPTLAAQFGFLPGTIWLIAGVVLGGAVQDFLILCASIRRDGKSLGQIAKEEVNPVAGLAAMVAIFAIMIILLAVLALVVVNALRDSPWGLFTLSMTIPIALVMGWWMNAIRPGKVAEATIIGIVLLMFALVGGQWVAQHPSWAPAFTWPGTSLSWAVMVYGFIASVLPVWLLLAPRDYLSAFMKVGTILLLAIAIMFVMPTLKMPAVTQFIDGTGPVFAGKLFPFAFITIACGAVSGFHALISSGTTPKMLSCEPDARLVGYGSMLTESLVGVMAMVAAATLDPGVYFAMNVGPATLGATSASASQVIAQWGFMVSPQQLDALAKQVGEMTLLSRTGGAPSLAVGMAGILGNVFSGAGLALWYHFDHVRGGVHPHHDRRRHACRPLHAAGAARSRVRAARAHVVVSEHPDLVGARGARLGLFSLSGRDRSAWRHQLAVAALRHRESAARRGGALRRGDDPDQDGEDPLLVGADRAAGVARGGDADRGMAEGVLARSEARVPLARDIARQQHRTRGRAHDLQRPRRRGPRGVLHGHRLRGDPRIGARVVSGGGAEEDAGGERGAVRGVEAGWYVVSAFRRTVL